MKEIVTSLRESRKTLKEGQYSQYDAEVMADWFNKVDEIYMGGAGAEVRHAFEEADSFRLALHQKVFAPGSGWKVRRGRKGMEVYSSDE